MTKRVIGIGNALVDILVRVADDGILAGFGLPKGSMQLVDEKKSEGIKTSLADHESSVSAGGSVANTIHALGMLGMSSGYIGSVGNDNNGRLFSGELEKAGVKPVIISRDQPTGTAVTIVTPDSERTFATHLGAAVELMASELKAEFFEGYHILYLEGYLIINYALALFACRLAKSKGLKVAIDLASYNVVENNRRQFNELIDNYVDVLFANEEEALALTGYDANESAAALSRRCPLVVIKQGARGSVIREGEKIYRAKAMPASVVDTTGAGDMYAAGFLYGLSAGETPDRCAMYGSLLAGNVVEVIGAKLSAERWQAVKQTLGK